MAELCTAAPYCCILSTAALRNCSCTLVGEKGAHQPSEHRHVQAENQVAGRRSMENELRKARRAGETRLSGISGKERDYSAPLPTPGPRCSCRLPRPAHSAPPRKRRFAHDGAVRCYRFPLYLNLAPTSLPPRSWWATSTQKLLRAIVLSHSDDAQFDAGRIPHLFPSQPGSVWAPSRR